MSTGKVMLTADQISNKWATRMKNSVADIQLGIDNVSESPAERAIAKKDKMLMGITRAINDGTWAAGLRNVSLADWKKSTRDKVATRLAGGVDAAMPKRKAFDNWLVGTINSILPQINAMPDMTLEDSINRMGSFIRAMSDNRYKRG